MSTIPVRNSFTPPTGPFALLPLRSGVLLPGVVTTVPVGRARSTALLQHVEPGTVLGVAVQRDRAVENPALSDLLPVATYARVRNVFALGGQQHRLVIEGLGRLQLERLVELDPYWQAEGHPAVELYTEDLEARALAQTLLERVRALAPSVNEKLAEALASPLLLDNPGLVADMVTAGLGLSADREIEVLMTLDVRQRLRRVHGYIGEAKEFAEIKNRVDEEVHRNLSRGQREVMLRQHLRAIQKELGEGDEGGDDLDELRLRLEQAEPSEEAKKVIERELRRLAGMGPQQAEYHVGRKYLELIAELPWSRRAPLNDDLSAVQQTLDADHAGLQDVKRRIVEHLAVRKMTRSNRGTILCLVGPPGVGKTSLGRSIASATGRPFARISLGGVRDEAEIRGHRRTYVGALPGRILGALRQTGAKNPVLLIDEIDKLTQGWMGSPESALLEVLDPEQNSTFTDSYLELPFDLSEVLFLCTANTLDTLSAPLRDRLEIVELQGYTLEEKLDISRRHLLPRQLTEHGLHQGALALPDETTAALIADYTREAGVRQLNRELTRICRAVTVQVASTPEAAARTVWVDVADLPRYLGKKRFFNDVAERTQIPGVAVGLAWTPVGGDILFIETSRMPGKGRLELTGMLGDVMKESAHAALTYVRSHAEALGIDPAFLDSQDVHIHVPAGAVPKDGPSAGVTMFTALASLLTGRLTRSDTAMTGECTLRGRVLPVGGIKAKVLAARRAGLRRVILPRNNEPDLEDLPAEVRDSMEFLFVEDMSEVLAAALDPVRSSLQEGGGGGATSTTVEPGELGPPATTA